MNPLASYLRFGDLYLSTNQIDSMQFIGTDAVEIRTKAGRLHVIKGVAVISLQTYINNYTENFNLS
jgi:hypothetical protein